MAEMLTVHNAQITTAAVEIQTLTIRGKQVTLAVFRQLLERDLIDPDSGSFNGLPWGTVNYHPDRCAERASHHHVVWQEGDGLRRSLVSKPRSGRFWSQAAHDLVVIDTSWEDAAYRGHPSKALAVNGTPQYAEIRSGRWHDGDNHDLVRFSFEGMAIEVDRPALLGMDMVSDPMLRRDETVEDLAADVAAEKVRRRNLNRRWEELDALPQLFIAT